ncbi:MAG: tripartite tricarboxylate transporter substrate binding protein [Betaproteobacteria bacterium]
MPATARDVSHIARREIHSHRSVPLLFLLAACLTSGAPVFSAQDFPRKPVRVIVPLAPGGGVDITTRTVSQKLTEAWGQTVVVDNRSGASGIIGLDLCAKSAADGYTLVVITTTHAGHPATQSALPYDLQRDFAPITQMTSQPYILVAHPSVAATTVKELIAVARARPAGLTYGSSGTGGLSHLSGAQLAAITQTNLVHVPYKGGGPALADLLAGQINILFATPLESVPHIKANRIRALAVSTAKRSAAMPDLPTLDEAGAPGFDVSGWYGVAAPAATPRDIVMKINAAIVRVLRLPEIVERFAKDGVETVGTTPEQFRAHVAAEIAKWKRVAAGAGLLKTQ